MALTDQQCRAAKPAAKPYKLADERGLYLYVTPTGFKSWRLKYRFGGKEQRIVFGPYPDVSLRMARDMRLDARKDLRDGHDPGAEFRRRATRRNGSADPWRSFETVAKRWHAHQAPLWKVRHAHDVLTSLTAEVFPVIGAMDIGEIKPAAIRDLLDAVQQRGAIETAHRIRQRISAVFGYAIANDLVEVDPAARVSAALRPVVKGKQPALLKLADARAFLTAFEAEPGHPTTRLASRLLALTAVRPGVIRIAQIGEFEGLEGSDPVWRIPAAKMKLSKAKSEQEEFEFLVPLSRQAVQVVQVAAALSRGRNYLFPSARHSRRPITDNALNAAYRRMPGIAGRHVPHGWRATFSTIMNERAIAEDRPGDRAIIDLMLAHEPEGVESRYNRAAYMPRRRELAQAWADLLMEGVAPAASLLDLPRR
ncbi:integrase arm-type DNA-binding domain-containing protein [Novosphingobium sp. FSW06-99]|uniref:tyrosine-type recombinase/integrase n=1 Tax=Novosphingobium sp. FSW06-99 TaxID=1739113 RepID=UPI00076BE43E|nr:integrase arm-type DNA-binding domain-containing protein [Novosphingobium sp. FSW06-99]KUR80729.1 integrase [Novosphingobium sp. FSW06-99]